jgi:hypothetical protein
MYTSEVYPAGKIDDCKNLDIVHFWWLVEDCVSAGQGMTLGKAKRAVFLLGGMWLSVVRGRGRWVRVTGKIGDRQDWVQV